MNNTVTLALGAAGFSYIGGVEFALFNRAGGRNYTVTLPAPGRAYVEDHTTNEHFHITVFELVGRWLA